MIGVQPRPPRTEEKPMQHEPTAMAFCQATETPPEALTAAWQHFSSPGLDSGQY